MTVAPDKPCKGPKAAPKKRGRKRKNEDEQQADGEGNNAALFQDQEGVAGVAVPAVTEGPDIAAAAEAVPEPAPVQDLTAKFPTRATFAGRAKTGTEDAQAMFDNRRTAFYQGTPEHLWKNKIEREFWKACTESDPALDLPTVVKTFLETQTRASDIKPVAKVKAKAKAVCEKTPGRARGRGRGFGGRGKMSVRQ